MRVYTSNRLEILADHLAQILAEPVSSVLAPETIVVQSRGMERWISLEISRRLGIFANGQFPFPNAFLYRLFQTPPCDTLPESPHDADALAMRLMQILPDAARGEAFSSIRRYLQNDPKGLKLFQLAVQIAAVFDQYLIFRPQMIDAWEQGREDHWQARLWRALGNDTGPLHIARLRDRFLERLKQPGVPAGLPDRVFIFGISYLPAFHLTLFNALAQVVPVYFFLMNPCADYWGDVVSHREVRRLQDHYEAREQSVEWLHLDPGNPLLASMGTLGRDFLNLISDFECEFFDLFQEGDADSILGRIQRDILHMTAGNAEAAVLFPDASLQIHACHSPMREVEVLYDQLCALFDADARLEPQDVLVMTPDIDGYAPLIRAVFGCETEAGPKIPFSLADQHIRMESRLIEGFLSLFDLADSRFGAVQVLSVLEIPGVKEKFDLSEADVEKIEGWVRQTHIRWGIDGFHRCRFDVPKTDENTWQAGVERLLLGIAMPGGTKCLFQGVLPHDGVEGQDSLVLGVFIDFWQALVELARHFEALKTMAEWTVFLKEILDRFIAPLEPLHRELQMLHEILEELRSQSEMWGWQRPVDVAVVKNWILHKLARIQSGAGFMAQGVTFCAMLPMRSIPFKVICLLGMDHTAFPRNDPAPGFDLVARHPKPGDRSRRRDDKYLFLEALVSARRTLYISYVGRSIIDNAPIPPSVLVSELLDYIQTAFGITEGMLVTQHPLQPFSKAYFTADSPLFSYSPENFSACQSLCAPWGTHHFFSAPLPEPSVEYRTLDVEDLCRFFRNPSRFLLQRRLGVILPETSTALEENEPFQLDPLTQYQLTQWLTRCRLAGEELAALEAVVKAGGQLPHGAAGEIVWQRLRMETDALTKKIQVRTEGASAAKQPISFLFGEFSISGMYTGLYPFGLLYYRCSVMQAKTLLEIWIRHLVYCAAAAPPEDFTTTAVFKDAVQELTVPPAPHNFLQVLLELYWQGLTQPLAFLPESAYAYAKHRQEGLPPAAAFEKADRLLLGSMYKRGEAEDPYFRIGFRNRTDVPAEAFQAHARAVFDPLLAHSAKIDG